MWFKGVRHYPVQGHSDGPMRSHRGGVLHVNESNGSLDNWVSGDHDVSCHVEFYKDGTATQYLDTGVSSWCQKAGNWDWLSFETEGYTGEPLTEGQLNRIADVIAQAHKAGIFPVLAVADNPLTEQGLGWHGMGAAHGLDWGHSVCPGDIRKGQRGEIIKRAQAILNPAPTPAPTPEVLMARGLVLAVDRKTKRRYLLNGDRVVPLTAAQAVSVAAVHELEPTPVLHATLVAYEHALRGAK